ncbi:MAG: hypothetical protein KatS3mg027_0574 [Bacteroidia bacterium]|nr:MAG: hypothetical protein KatS3mg027_0574 [Bacteroidia bacterium]
MKKILFTVLSIGYFSLIAQNQGTAVYQMSIEGLPPEQAAMMGDMEMKIVWKDNKTYSEQNSMMYSMRSVSDEKETLILMEMMGNKNYMRINHDDPKYNNDKGKEVPEYKVEYFNETKKIAGYDCKKALVTTKTKDGKEMTMEVWYTEQVPNVYSQQKYTSKRNQNAAYLKGLKGMPLEYSIPQGQMTVKVTAKEINFNPVSDDVFKLSTEGYTEMKPEDMKKMGGGQ